jgi:hypothetical protein
LLDGFLHHHFACDQVFLDHFTQLWRVLLLALGNYLLDQCFDARRWDGLAVDDSDVLREGRDGDEGDKS